MSKQRAQEYIERACLRGMLETALRALSEIAYGHKKGTLLEAWELREVATVTEKELRSDLKGLPHHLYDFRKDKEDGE